MPIVQYPSNSIGGAPFGNESQHAYGSPFMTTPGQAPTALDPQFTVHLARFIFKEIVGTDPEPYFAALKMFMFNGTPDVSNSSVFTWIEKPSQRYAPTALVTTVVGAAIATATLQVGVTGGYVEYTIPLSDADYAITPTDNDIMFPGNAFGTIVGKTPASGPTPAFITVRSLVSAGLPAVLQGDRLPLMGEIRADGMERIANVQRMQTVERFNYVATFMRSMKWGTKEQLEWIHNANTTYREDNQKELILNLKYDALVNMFAAKKEMRQLSGGEYAKGFDGLYPQMLAGGSATATTTLGNFIPTFEAMGQNTNYKSKGGVRLVIGRTEHLTHISKEYKSLQTRYAPNDMVANLELDEIRFGGQRYVLVPCDVFGDINYFNSDWHDRLFVVDTGTVKTVTQRGLPMMDISNMLLESYLQSFRDTPRSLRDYKVWSAEINLSMKMIEPRGSYIINLV